MQLFTDSTTSSSSASSDDDTNPARRHADKWPWPESPPGDRLLTDLLHLRQLGIGSSKQACDWFQTLTYGSASLIKRLECMWKLRKHDGCVNCLNFNPSGQRLASGSDDTNVVVWDWAANRPLYSFETGHFLNVFQVKYLPLAGGDTHLVTAARDGQVRLAELSELGECKVTKRLARHSDSVHKVKIQCDCSTLAPDCARPRLSLRVPVGRRGRGRHAVRCARRTAGT